jgi:hypothetical protein
MKDTQVTDKIFEGYSNLFGPSTATIGTLKALSIASSQLPSPRLFIAHSAPSGHLKTWTSKTASSLFPKSWILDLKSDFTIHNLFKQNEKKDGSASVDKKCLMINDATLLFSSKAKRTEQRLVNGLAELMTDGVYRYGDFGHDFTIKGNISLVMNLTTKSYTRHLESLLGNTFDERCLTIHTELSAKEQNRLSTIPLFSDTTRIFNIPCDLILRLKSGKTPIITIPAQLQKLVKVHAWKYTYLGLKGFPRTQATINAIVRASAFINGRTEVCREDFEIVKKAKDYLVNPLQPNRPRIVSMLKNKVSVAEICRILGKDFDKYKTYVYRVWDDAKLKGLLG